MKSIVKNIAHSINEYGEELLSVEATFPRIVLAEVNTHRMLVKNTSSSRAIPFLKMVESVVTNPFIPYAFQKHHSGMQGTEYLDTDEKVKITTFFSKLSNSFKESKKFEKRIDELVLIIETYTPIKERFTERTLADWWLFARDKAVQSASIMYAMGVTKQLCNRLLEPFMWTTMCLTGSVEHGWENFFRLRCPAYTLPLYDDNGDFELLVFKSKNEALDSIPNWYIKEDSNKKLGKFLHDFTEEDWRYINKSQAEIHIQDLAENIYEALRHSTPKKLKEGEWHILYEDEIDNEFPGLPIVDKIAVSTSKIARTSYTVIDASKTALEKHIELFVNLENQDPPHSSPFEHNSFVPRKEVREQYVRGKIGDESAVGWFGPFKGFINYRFSKENM